MLVQKRRNMVAALRLLRTLRTQHSTLTVAIDALHTEGLRLLA